MKWITAYCSARDQDVRLVLTDEPVHDDTPSPIHDGIIVCLEIGEHCSGALCPLGAIPLIGMSARVEPQGKQKRQGLAWRALSAMIATPGRTQP